jgi:hypothetical protein
MSPDEAMTYRHEIALCDHFLERYFSVWERGEPIGDLRPNPLTPLVGRAVVDHVRGNQISNGVHIVSVHRLEPAANDTLVFVRHPDLRHLDRTLLRTPTPSMGNDPPPAGQPATGK